MSTAIQFLIPSQIHKMMIKQAHVEHPNECCGALTGTFDASGVCRIIANHALTNELVSETEYQANPKELLQVAKSARAEKQEIVGFYHSHPTSAAIPSRKDREQNWWGEEVIHFIISLENESAEMKGWHLRPDKYWQADWRLIDDDPPDDSESASG